MEAPCPGGCERPVPLGMPACMDCWGRLPDELRRAENLAYYGTPTRRGALMAARAAIRQWLLRHPAPAASRPA